MSRETLTKMDWITAAFRAMAREGPDAIQIKVLAADIGATKGSFYWHFRDLAALKLAMLETWEEKAATEIIEAARGAPSAQERLARLQHAALQPAPAEFGGRRIEAAMRAWALSDKMAAEKLETIDRKRMAFLESLLAEFGHRSPVLARLVYGAFIGLDDLETRDRVSMEAPFEALLHALGLPND